MSKGNTFRGRMVNKRKDGVYFTEEATINSLRWSESKPQDHQTTTLPGYVSSAACATMPCGPP